MTALPSNRILNEKKTVAAMVHLYCREEHGTESGPCERCRQLLDYAWLRLDKCTFGEQKPVCSKCPTHCYRPAMRQEITRVMRFAGPRMLFSHPRLAIAHLFNSWRGVKDGKKLEAS